MFFLQVFEVNCECFAYIGLVENRIDDHADQNSQTRNQKEVAAGIFQINVVVVFVVVIVILTSLFCLLLLLLFVGMRGIHPSTNVKGSLLMVFVRFGGVICVDGKSRLHRFVEALFVDIYCREVRTHFHFFLFINSCSLLLRENEQRIKN